MVDVLRLWSTRRWLVAVAATAASVLALGLPTAVIPNPVFGRAVAVTWWSYPVLAVTAVLSGLLFATYVAQSSDAAPTPEAINRTGTIGGLLSFFAVGCPVCNKLALILLGSAGAMQWFAPIQPYLAVAGVALLAWALVVRLRGERACPVAVSG